MAISDPQQNSSMAAIADQRKQKKLFKKRA